ncbi:LysR family transcriptional regulator [Streptococcus sp. 121]|uniref:LysR family transcriptional regulator n=1 Tax=Streptococcus sp. 121 TaxID=2797637 RepID=UPI0018F06007|nr:LysR family transcriptional regulator [Streptococcus sp. 121]MBJ6746483.1 LysR family transcriptional regulator [Streptococcus sp. 121]
MPLNIYKTIYELNSINKAAQKLGYAQSNVTTRLKTIEQEFNTSFFKRSYKGVTPTESGRAFYEYACEVLDLTQTITEKLDSNKKKKSVKTTEILFQYIVEEMNDYSLTDNQFIITKSSTIIKDTNPTEDIITSYYPINHKSYSLTQIGNLLITPVAKQGTDVTQLPVLVNSDEACPFRKKTMETIPKNTEIIEIDSFVNIIQLVENGQGFALLPNFLARKHNFLSINDKTYQIPFYTFEKDSI